MIEKNLAFERHIAASYSEAQRSARHFFYGDGYDVLFGKDDWPENILSKHVLPGRLGTHYPMAALFEGIALILSFLRKSQAGSL